MNYILTKEQQEYGIKRVNEEVSCQFKSLLLADPKIKEGSDKGLLRYRQTLFQPEDWIAYISLDEAYRLYSKDLVGEFQQDRKRLSGVLGEEVTFHITPSLSGVTFERKFNQNLFMSDYRIEVEGWEYVGEDNPADLIFHDRSNWKRRSL